MSCNENATCRNKHYSEFRVEIYGAAIIFVEIRIFRDHQIPESICFTRDARSF